MKSIWFLMLLLFYCKGFSQAKPLVTVNSCDHEDFSTYDKASIKINNCIYDIYQESSSNRSVANWYNFSGNAQIDASAFNATDYYVILDATSDNYGSSTFAYIPVQNNFGYTFKVLAMAPHGSGEIDVHGENDLPEEHYNCHDMIYDPGQELATFIISSSSFNVYPLPYSQLTFPTSSDPYYSQVYVSPKFLSGTSPYIVYMKYLELCPDCASSRTYTDVAPAFTTTFGNIFMQSAAGTTDKTTVENDQTTVFNAYQQVELDPWTEIAPTSTGSFVAEIIDCPTGSQSFARKAAKSSLTEEKPDILFMKDKIYAYPNPVHSILSLQLDDKYEEWESIKIVNTVGKVVKAMDNKSVGIIYPIKIDLSNLNIGTYFIQVQTKSKTFTQKIIKD